MGKILLNSNWIMNKIGTNQQYDTSIPAMVAYTLFQNDVIKDPYFGENEWETLESLRSDYEFSKEFEISKEMIDSDKLEIVFHGLDTIADIYINDKLIAYTDDMHRTYAFDIKDYVKPGLNSIRIYFTSPTNHALELYKKDPIYKTSDTLDGFEQVRKAHSMYGWDWGPQLPDMGIWRDIEIEASNIANILDYYITQEHRNYEVSLDFRIDVEKYQQEDVEIKINVISPDNEMYTVRGYIDSQDNFSITINNPMLWWCNGFGKQHLYTVEIELLLNNQIIDKKNMRIGLRTLTVNIDKDEWGEKFEFCLNGISIFAMGSNYIPEDSLIPLTNKQRSRWLLQQCIKANHNCIRVWGGGYFCDDYFYDLCDEFGLIVWQDLMFACAVYKLTESFKQNIIAETKDNMKRIRHHACLGLWCGNNENEWGWSGWDMGFGDNPYRKADYIKMFEQILPDVAKEVDPNTFYWVASPSSGGSFDDPNDQNRGDVHFWEVWHRLKPFVEYRKYYFRFCSEFGFQSFPCEKTIDSFADEDDKNIFSAVMENHQKNGTANSRILFYLADNFKYPTSFEILLYASQILQAEAIKYGVEHWRSNRGRCMGSLYWQLNDCWPVASWSSIDYFGRWKALHYYSKRFYAPLLLSAIENEGMVDFIISNETMNTRDTKIFWKLKRNTGETIWKWTKEYKIDKLKAELCNSKDFTDIIKDKQLARTCYVEYQLEYEDEIISYETLLFVKPKHFEFLPPQITYSVREMEDKFILSFETVNYAKYISIDSQEFDFVASDNYFDLSKGNIKKISIHKENISKDISVKDLESLNILSAYDIK